MVDVVGLKLTVDTSDILRATDKVKEKFNEVANGADQVNRSAQQASAATAQNISSVAEIGRVAQSSYQILAQSGTSAWDQVARAAQSSAQQQVSAAQNAQRSVEGFGASGLQVTSGLPAFRAESRNIDSAADNLAFLQRLSRGGRLASSDVSRARGLGLVNEFGVNIGRIQEALEVQQSALSSLQRRAFGGNVGRGEAFLVGERGPELFVPNENGQVVANDQLAQGNVVVNVSIDGSGDPKQVARAVVDLINREASLGKPMVQSEGLRSSAVLGG